MSGAEDLDRAENLVEGGRFDQAFELLNKIATRAEVTTIELADTYHLMGTIVQLCPRLGAEDECGLSYFKRALTQVSNHVWALYGVVSTFGDAFPDHQDIDATRSAILQLENRLTELPSRMQATVCEKRQLSTDSDVSGSASPANECWR